MKYNYINYAAIYGRSHMWVQQEETVTTIKNGMKTMTKNNTTTSTDDSAKVSTETNFVTFQYGTMQQTLQLLL